MTDDDRVQLKPIDISRILDGTIEVRSGLTPQDRIVDNPSAALLDGEKVRVVTPAPGYTLSVPESGKTPD